MNLSDAFGTVGLVLLLGAFVGNVLGRIPATTLRYQGMNFFGSAILVWYSWQLGSVIFMVLEAVWAAFALAGLVRSLRSRV